MTREEIEKFSEVEPYCFETDREARYYDIGCYKMGCIDGLKAADAEPNLESLYHDASEEPKGSFNVLCDNLDNRQCLVNWLYIDMVYFSNWEAYVKSIGVIR